MDTKPQIHRLRLALSYQDKTVSVLHRAERAFKSGELERTRFDVTVARYNSHVQRAKAAVRRAKDALAEILSAQESELAAVQTEQTDLGKKAAAGKIRAEKANEHNRALMERATALESEIALMKRALAADHAKDLGETLEHPIEAYPKLLGMSPKARDTGGGGKPAETKRTWLQARTVFLCLVGALMIAGLVWAWNWWNVPDTAIRFIATADTGAQSVTVQLTNESGRTIFVYAPWPNGNPNLRREDRPPGPAFGFLVYVREARSDEFVLAENTYDAWDQPGGATVQAGPVEILPGFKSEFRLNAPALRSAGLRPDVVRVALTRRNGEELHRYDLYLP